MLQYDFCHTYVNFSRFDLFLPTYRRRRGLLFHQITLCDTLTHALGGNHLYEGSASACTKITASERPQTSGFDHAATGVGHLTRAQIAFGCCETLNFRRSLRRKKKNALRGDHVRPSRT